MDPHPELTPEEIVKSARVPAVFEEIVAGAVDRYMAYYGNEKKDVKDFVKQAFQSYLHKEHKFRASPEHHQEFYQFYMIGMQYTELKRQGEPDNHDFFTDIVGYEDAIELTLKIALENDALKGKLEMGNLKLSQCKRKVDQYKDRLEQAQEMGNRKLRQCKRKVDQYKDRLEQAEAMAKKRQHRNSELEAAHGKAKALVDEKKIEAGNWKTEAGNWKTKAVNWKDFADKAKKDTAAKIKNLEEAMQSKERSEKAQEAEIKDLEAIIRAKDVRIVEIIHAKDARIAQLEASVKEKDVRIAEITPKDDRIAQLEASVKEKDVRIAEIAPKDDRIAQLEASVKEKDVRIAQYEKKEAEAEESFFGCGCIIM